MATAQPQNQKHVLDFRDLGLNLNMLHKVSYSIVIRHLKMAALGATVFSAIREKQVGAYARLCPLQCAC